MRALLLIPLLAACDAGHLGNPLTLPARAVGAGIENASYNARRDRVSGVLAQYQRAVLSDTEAQAALWQSAMTPEANRSKVLREIAELPLDATWVEKATVIVMVHS